MAARLKVFSTSDGLTDYVVATSSRPKALAAWGVRQDLFKEGRAVETEDPALRKAALAQPGQVLRRPSGSRASLARQKAPPKPDAPKPSKAAIRRVATLERKLEALAASEAATRGRIEAERLKLEERLSRARAKFADARSTLEDDLRQARRALKP